MTETVHPAVGEAARILLQARGCYFSPPIKYILDKLLPATKKRDAQTCWVWCDSLWQYDEFREWAMKHGIDVRTPKDPFEGLAYHT